MTTARPSTDVDRRQTLELSGILDFPVDPFFDSAAALAAQISECPVALVGFFDGERELIRGRHRWNVAHLDRESAPGLMVLAKAGAVVVPDASVDDLLRSNALVLREPKIRFYAGVPILSPRDQVMGVLEVFDRVPRSISEPQLESLRQLARGLTQYINTKAQIVELSDRVSGVDDVEQQLRERDERFREIFDNVDDLIMTIRTDGRLMHFNGACPGRLGYDPQSLTGMSIFDLVHSGARSTFRREFDRILKEGESDRLETTFTDAFGHKLIVEGTLTPKVIDGVTVLLRVIFRDITDRKRSEIDLARTRDEALEAARLKSQFLSNVSHEVRTPIHAIVGMLGLLSDSGLSNEQRDFVNSARTAADSLLQTINNILYVSRLEAGKLTTNLSDFDVVGTVNRVVDVMKIAAEEKGLTLDLHVEEGVPMIVRGEPGRYRQVLNNVIGNAIKFTSEGRVDVRMRVERETETHTLVRLEVADTGVGIAKDAQPKLFTSFSQADGSATRNHEGMGLGLSIARQLVELMGGAIGFETMEGKGTTFWVTVPFERRAEDDLASAGSRLAFPGTRVLILDSSDTNRRLIEHFVASWGMRHRIATTGAEAMQRLVTDAELGDPVHVLIADVRYPGTDVLELARSISSNPATSSTAVIVTVPLGESVDDRLYRESGVAAYVSRPVERSDLFDCMNTALVKGPRSLTEVGHAAIRNENAGETQDVPLERRASTSILIAEDKALNQKLTVSQLRSLGYKADVAPNGVEVLAALDRHHYDVVFMDCQMPVMDGYETTMEIRRRQAGNGRTWIIAMTANALEGDREKCLAAGMDDYLSKPTRREDLEAALARAIGRTP